MVGLVAEVAVRISISGAVTLLFCAAFPSLLALGESAFQNSIVLAIYIYCATSLFTASSHKLFYVLSIPVICQFLHLFQKYAFAAGSNSIWRLFPFLLLDVFLLDHALNNLNKLATSEKFVLVLWIIINAFLILVSPNLPGIFIGAPVLYLVTIPLFFNYMRSLCEAVDFRRSMEEYLCLLYVILGIGTFGLVAAGASYKGSDNLLVTRNISDTNVTMAYFILLWPLAVLYCKQLRFKVLATLALTLILSSIVVVSFSRGSAIIILPYLALSLLIIFSFRKLLLLSTTALFIAYNSATITSFLENQGLVYSWQLRIQDFDRNTSGYQKLRESSGRAAIHDRAISLFLESPAFGHGIGSFEVLGPGYREAHSLFYTWLAEEGVIGTSFKYGLIFILAVLLLRLALLETKLSLLLLALSFYLLFSHTVGSVFFIIPAKSLTINCFAPMLLICLYCYAKSVEMHSSRD